MARTDITPPVGIYSRTWGVPGTMLRRACTDRHWQVAWFLRHLTVEHELIFITLDSCCADDGEVAAIRAAILKRFGLSLSS